MQSDMLIDLIVGDIYMHVHMSRDEGRAQIISINHLLLYSAIAPCLRSTRVHYILELLTMCFSINPQMIYCIALNNEMTTTYETN